MRIELPTDADAFIKDKAAAAGFGDDVEAYVAHLITQDQPDRVADDTAADDTAADSQALARLEGEAREVAAVQEGINAYERGNHEPWESFSAQFMAEHRITAGQ